MLQYNIIYILYTLLVDCFFKYEKETRLSNNRHRIFAVYNNCTLTRSVFLSNERVSSIVSFVVIVLHYYYLFCHYLFSYY